MKYDYVVILRKSSDRQIDFISLFICLFSIVAFVFQQFEARQFNYIFSLGALVLASGIAYNIVASMRHRQVRYRYLLFLAGILWIGMPFLSWISICLFLLAFLEYQAKHPLEVGFSGKEVVINSLFRRRFVWTDFNNILLKDGLLTIDFRNNRLFQKETIDDDDPDADEDEFNSYCRERLNIVATGLTTINSPTP